MKVLRTIKEVAAQINHFRNENRTIGFVPTMGALHEGHISLVNESIKNNHITVVSIFVNPIQFNNPDDLKNYPRNLEKDLKILEENNCDLVFCPDEKEMYPNKDTVQFDLGGLDKPMEGIFRPGHFQGVAVIVKKLLEIVQPDRAYFGKKDFQQLSIVKYIVKNLQIPVQIVGCETVRESDGLAKSSRNLLLSPEMRKEAPLISQTLFKCRELQKKMSVLQVNNFVEDVFIKSEYLKLEYFFIVDELNLRPIEKWDSKQKAVACIAVWAGNVRLIDNIFL